MSDDQWPNVCELCADHGTHTRLRHGRCCARCLTRLTDQLHDIPRLADHAAAAIIPNKASGSSSRHLGPSYPINFDAVDPALAHVPGYDAPLLAILEEWERYIRAEREMTPYGPASVSRAAANAGKPAGEGDRLTSTLRAVCAFLASHSEWAASTPNFPLTDYMTEIRDCARVLRRWDPTTAQSGTALRCPTLLDNTECNQLLHYHDVHDTVTCPRCRQTRSAMTLAAIAMADGRNIWLDPEAAASYLGISEQTLRRWAAAGKIQRDHGRYRITHNLQNYPDPPTPQLDNTAMSGRI